MASFVSNSKNRRAGFTLVEVVLAVMILSLIIMAVYGIWSAALRGWNRGGEASAVFQRQRIVMEALTELAESAVYFGAAPDLYAITGTRTPNLGDSVSFVTASDAFLPPSEANDQGMRRVTISLERDEYQRTYLAIVNQPALVADDKSKAGDLQTHVISMDVSAFYVRYMDPRNGSWEEKWEEPNLIPSAMEFTVVFGQPGDTIPPVTVTRAVDLPVADFIAKAINPGATPMTSTNDVQRRTVDISGSGSNGGQQPPGQTQAQPGTPAQGGMR